MNAITKGFTGIFAVVLAVFLSHAAMAQDLTNTGTWTNSGTLRVNNLTNSGAGAHFANSGASSLLQVNAALTTNAGGALPANFDVTVGAVHYGGAAQSITDQVKSNTYNKLCGSGTGTKTLAGNIIVADSLTADGVTVSIGANTLTLSGPVAGADVLKSLNAGSFTFTGGTVDYAGNAQNVFASTYGTLGVTASGAKSLQGTTGVNTDLTLSAGSLALNGKSLNLNSSTITTTSGTLSGGTTSAITFAGTGSTTLPSVSSGLDTLVVNRTGGATITLAATSNLTVNSQLTLTSGTFALGSDSLALFKGVSATSGTISSGAAGAVNYAQTTDGQSVLASNYGSLYFSDHNKTLPAGTVGISGYFGAGAATGHTITGNTIAFNGAAQSIPSFNGATGYNNLTLSGDGVVKTASGNITVAGTLQNGQSTDSTVFNVALNSLTAPTRSQTSRSNVQFSGASNGLVFTTGWVEYNGSVTQTVALGTYANLLFSSTGQKSITGGTVATSSGLNIGSSVPVNVSGTGTLSVAGDLTNSGTVTNAGTVTVGP